MNYERTIVYLMCQCVYNTNVCKLCTSHDALCNNGNQIDRLRYHNYIRALNKGGQMTFGCIK